MDVKRLLAWIMLGLLGGLAANAQEIWQTAEGQRCIEKWIRDTTSRLNGHSGSSDFNANKPWGMNQYGHFTARNLTQNYEPDVWSSTYRGNKYHYMWGAAYQSELHHPDWRNSNFNNASVQGMRYFVRQCMGGATPPRPPPPPPGSVAVPASCSSSQGTLSFTGSISGVLARYGTDQGRIVGDWNGGRINGYWVEASSAQRCSRAIDGSYHWGRFVAEFSGSQFTGKWSYCDGAPDRSWTGGNCVGGGGGSPPRGDVASLVAGGWSSSEGATTFTGEDSGVLARYGSDQGRIVGELRGSQISGYWVERTSAQRCGTQINGSFYWGRFEAVFDAGLRAFTGKWGYCSEKPNRAWTGQR